LDERRTESVIYEGAYLDSKNMKILKKHEEDDFVERIKINYEGVSLNTTLRENLFCIFVCTMKCLPIIIVGCPGSSKSLACRIICDTMRGIDEKDENADPWLKRFPNIVEFFFQGSEGCKTDSVEKRFQSAQDYIKEVNKGNRGNN
jgi:hypothetical protein